MNSVALLTLIGWIPATFLLSLALPRRTAVLVSVVFGMLFLPCGEVHFSGIPDINKQMVSCLGPCIAAVLIDPLRVLRFRPSWRDLPVTVLFLCPFASSVFNGLGVHDGLSEVFQAFLLWGVPYFLGRIYLADADGLRALARALLIGGIVYVPLCLFEIKMSPQLHELFYGFRQSSWEGTRYGTYRPVVFLMNSLMVGSFMSMASVVSFAEARFRMIRPRLKLPIAAVVGALVVTTILTKCIAAILLMGVGAFAFAMARRGRARWILVVLFAYPQLFVAGRVTGLVDRATMSGVLSLMPADRSESLDYRAKNEDLLVVKALKQPLFGWGGWSRSRIIDESGDDLSIVDSIWILILGKNGLVGLAALMGVLFVGPSAFLANARPSTWTGPGVAPAFCLALIAAFFAIDCTLNALINPVLLMAIGGLVGFRPAPRPAPAGFAPAPPPP